MRDAIAITFVLALMIGTTAAIAIYASPPLIEWMWSVLPAPQSN
jgi:hypothetical protein